MKYFFIQRLGSGIFIRLFYLGVLNIKSVLCLVIRYKVGAGPFFFWFPSLCVGICWVSYFVLLTFQKFIPLIIINVFLDDIIFFIAIFSLLVGIFGSFNQCNIKQLLAYSSVFHLGWIIICNIGDDLYWLIYIFIYIYILFPLVYFFNNFILESVLEVIKLKRKIIFVFLILRIAGIPPLLGFFVKWFALNVIFKIRYYIIFMLIIRSVIIFYIYFRLLYDILLIGSDEGLWVRWNDKILFGNVWLDLLRVSGIILGGILLVLIIM